MPAAPPGTQVALPPPLAARPWLTQPVQPPPAASPSAEVPRPTQGLMGKRNLQPRTPLTGNTSCTYRLRYPVAINGSNLRMTFPAWFTQTAGIGDEATGNPVTVGACYVEYAGSLYPVTFNGASSVVIDSGGAVTCDPVAGLTVTAGSVLYVRTYVTVPPGGRWPGLYAALNYPDEVSRPGTNLANALGDLTGTGQSIADLYGPLRIFGDHAAGEPFYAVTICGDSIAAGTNDAFTTEGEVGYWQRKLWAPQNTRPYSIVALPGENGQMLLAQGANRADIVGEYVDYVVFQYGINDLQAGASLAQLQGRAFANTVISRNPWVNGRYQQTLGPKTSSTDGWATTANQTTDGINTARVAFNNWVRDGMPEVGQTAVPTGTVDAVRAGQGGHPFTGYIEVADLCESARDSGIWKPNYTSDGLHPNINGNTLMAAGLDLSLFVDTAAGGGAPPVTSNLARDASSPALRSSAFQGTTASQAWASNPFSPPAGSVLVVVAVGTESFNDPFLAPAFTDSLGTHLTWTLAGTAADVTVAGQTAAVWVAWAYCPAAQTNMTVTATMNNSSAGGQTIYFSSTGVEVFTGASTTAPIGAVVTGATSSTAISAAITPTGAGSALLIAAGVGNASNTSTSAGAGEYLAEETHTGTSVAIAWYGTAVGPAASTAGAGQTLDLISSAASPRTNYVAFEVKAAGATQTVNATFAVSAGGAASAAATSTTGGVATVTATATADATVTAGFTSATGTDTLTATATAAATRTGDATGTVTGTGTAAGTASHAGDAAGTDTLTPTATGAAARTGNSTQAVTGTATGTAAGTRTVDSTQAVTGTGTGTGAAARTVDSTAADTLTGTGAASSTRTGDAAGTVTGTAAADSARTAPATTALALAGTGTADGTVTGATGASATGALTATPTAAAAVTRTGDAAGTVTGTPTAAAAAAHAADAATSLTLTATAAGAGTRTGDATSAVTATPAGAGTAAHTADATGTVTATPVGTGTAVRTGDATRAVTAAGTATATSSGASGADATGALTGTGTGTAAATRGATTALALAGTGTADATVTRPAATTQAATATPTATGTGTRAGDATRVVTATSTADATPGTVASASLAAALASTATGTANRAGTASQALSGASTADAPRTTAVTGTALAVTFTPAATGARTVTADAALAVTATTTAAPARTAAATATAATTGTATAAAARAGTATAFLAAALIADAAATLGILGRVFDLTADPGDSAPGTLTGGVGTSALTVEVR